jgi:hypothetical protein
MQDTYWPEDAKSENDPALKVFNHLIDKLDYAKIRLQAGLALSDVSYCDECVCKEQDKEFMCPYTGNDKSGCILINIADRLKGNKDGGISSNDSR